MATLFITCGVPGSGKTTVARQLETKHRALRLTGDEWLHALYPEMNVALSKVHRPAVERVQWDLALRALANDWNVVLDWGLWSREERDRYRSEAQARGARVVLCLMKVSREELLRRLAARNADLPGGTFHISEAILDEGLASFERAPTADELALFDDVIVYKAERT